MNSETRDNAAEVAAMQFAGGMAIARVAESWDRDADWVETAIRQALLATIPRRDGGLKAPRSEVRAERETGARPGVQRKSLFEEVA